MEENNVPIIKQRLIERPRVRDLLDKAFCDNRIVYVGAQTGWGKTMAAVQWAQGKRCHWLTVTKKRSEVGDETETSGQVTLDDICRLDEAGKRGHYIVIDNFQWISRTVQKQILEYILDSSRKYLILSRTQAPLELSREEGRDVTVMGIEEMHFTAEEGRTYLKGEGVSENSTQMCLQIPAGKNGWILGLEFFAKAIRRCGGEFSRESQNYAREAIFEYFDQEVMGQFSNCKQDFLLLLGGFPRVSIRQMIHLTGRKDARQLMDDIQQVSSFFVLVDVDTYRMHPFFTDYIDRTRKRRMKESDLKRIYRNAGREFEAEKDYTMALESYLQGGDTQSMAYLLEQFAKEGVGKSGVWENRKFYRALSEAQILESPALCGSMAMQELLSFHLDKADWWEQKLKDLKRDCSPADSRYWEIKNQLDYLAIALPHHKYHHLFTRLRDLSRAAQDYTLNPQKIAITGNRPSVLNGGRDLSDYQRYAGPISRIMDDIAKKLYGYEAIGAMQVFYAECLYQKNQVPEALMKTVGVIPEVEQNGDITILFAIYYLQMRIMLFSGQGFSSEPMIESIHRKLLESGAEYLLPNWKAIRAWNAMYRGDLDMLDQWLRWDAPAELEDFCTHDRFQYFVKLRAYLIYNKQMEFLALAGRLKPVLEAFDRQMELCELNILLAMHYRAQGSKEKTVEYLEQALEIGEKRDLKRTFADEGERVYVLLKEYGADRQQSLSAFVKEVQELSKEVGLLYPAYLKKRSEFCGALTRPELAVLRLIADDRTNEEIARYLEVSISTVKFHSGHIFSKLQVKNRTQAVRQAKKFGIL